VLVTGVGGFAGRHLVTHLLAEGEGPLVGLARPDAVPSDLPPEVRIVPVDLNDRPAAELAVREARPVQVYHLAAQSSVADSHGDPLGTLFNNIGAQVNLLEALLRLGTRPRVLVIGSSEEYGFVRADELPVRETNELRPLSPYAVSKVAQDLLGFQYFKTHGLPVVRVRPFSHTGPGQEPRFATPAFARQVARIEAGLQPPVIKVGNLEARRDFSDVRDIVRGYRLALLHGEPGEAYNLGSGQAVSIRSVLERLLELSTSSVRVELDPARLRRSEAPPQYADCQKLRDRTGWRPTISLDETIGDVLADWRSRVARLGPRA
jgi:GDP-4-dehydro-6-deoxy-D-mannose reductase